MISFSIIWLCANDISKAENDIKKIQLFKKKKYVDLDINFTIIDRFSKEIIKQEWISIGDYQKNYLRSSKKINIYKDLKCVISRSVSTYVMLLPDDDIVNIQGLLQFLSLISNLPKEIMFLGVPSKRIFKGVNFNKLVSGRKYTFWEYQYARGYNLAYYSPMLKEQLELTIDNIINSSQKDWYYPNWDQIIIWIFLDKGKKNIIALDGFYLHYDNSNWESKDKKFLSYKKMKTNFLKNFYYSLNQIFSSINNISDFPQIIKWLKFLLFYQFNILKNIYYLPSVLILFTLAFLKKKNNYLN